MTLPHSVFAISDGRRFKTVPRDSLRFRSHGRYFDTPKHLKKLAFANIPVPPASFDLSRGEKLVFPIYGNDQYGDCYYAAMAHGSQCYTGNSGVECSFDINKLIARYLQVSGGDNGMNDSLAMPEWKSGIIGPNGPWRILDEMTVDLSNLASWKLAMWAFGGLIWTCSLLNGWMESAAPGIVWDATGEPDPNKGHAMYLTGMHTNGNVDTRTWGISPPIQVTRSGLQSADSEFIVVFSLDQFSSAGICAFTGMTYEQKAALWTQCGGQQLPPSPFKPAPGPSPAPVPGPTPAPVPVPAPPGGLTEQQIQQFIDGMFAALKQQLAGHPLEVVVLMYVQKEVDKIIQQMFGKE